MPASLMSKRPFTSSKAVSFALRSDNRSGWLLDNTGIMTAFGGAPARTTTNTGSTAYAKALMLVTNDSGYWVDGSGVLRPFGAAFGNPTRTVLGTNKARRAASL